MGLELALFGLLALLAVMSAAGMIFVRNAVHSALFLILNFGCVALLFLMLDAPFISMVQIAVYAGAIMVLFLFVIMLLGADQTSDTEARQFGWLTITTTILGAGILVFVGAILLFLSNGLHLPDPIGDNPQVRIVHAANIEGLVTIAIADNTFEGVSFGEDTGFIELHNGAGDYLLSVTDQASATSETVLSLQPGQVVTAVAYGAEGVEGYTLIPSNLESDGDDQARLNVINLYQEAPLFLVDLGSDGQLDIADGDIADTVITQAYSELGERLTLRDGTYPLRWVQRNPQGEYEILYSMDNWQINSATEQTLIVSPDYASVANDGQYRATVLDHTIPISEPFGAPGDIGAMLFMDYLLPVNMVGFLLLVALVGVIVLTRPEGLQLDKRATLNRRRKVSRPLVNVISTQTGRDVVVDTPQLDQPSSGD